MVVGRNSSEFFEDPLRADSGVSGVEENRGT
jgi:hypothetical protein